MKNHVTGKGKVRHPWRPVPRPGVLAASRTDAPEQFRKSKENTPGLWAKGIGGPVMKGEH